MVPHSGGLCEYSPLGDQNALKMHMATPISQLGLGRRWLSRMGAHAASNSRRAVRACDKRATTVPTGQPRTVAME